MEHDCLQINMRLKALAEMFTIIVSKIMRKAEGSSYYMRKRYVMAQ